MSGWTVIRGSAFDHPNVVEDREVIPGGPSREWIEDVRSEYGEDSPYYVARVLAEFPDEAVGALIERAWLEGATRRHREQEEPSGFYTIGVDPARHGPDETVCCIRRGGYVTGFESWQGKNTQESARRVLGLVRRLHGGGKSPVKTVCVDSIGLGAGVVDRVEEDLNTTWYESGHRGQGLREKRTQVVAFNSSKAAPDSERFVNTRAQSFWRLRKRLEGGEMALPALPLDDWELLEEELRAHRVEYTADGKTKVGDKKQIKARIGRSPDRADALAISLRPELEEAGSRDLDWA